MNINLLSISTLQQITNNTNCKDMFQNFEKSGGKLECNTVEKECIYADKRGSPKITKCKFTEASKKDLDALLWDIGHGDHNHRSPDKIHIYQQHPRTCDFKIKIEIDQDGFWNF